MCASLQLSMASNLVLEWWAGIGEGGDVRGLEGAGDKIWYSSNYLAYRLVQSLYRDTIPCQRNSPDNPVLHFLPHLHLALSGFSANGSHLDVYIVDDLHPILIYQRAPTSLVRCWFLWPNIKITSFVIISVHSRFLEDRVSVSPRTQTTDTR